jgi:dTDP-4-dehydrorhamnose reductase
MHQRRSSDSLGRTPTADYLDPHLEVWGGVEATVNRIGDQYHDQLKQSGHVDRIEDLELFATLGIRAIRYPVLWERIAPNGLETADWSWTDARLPRLRALGIRPIAGLLHHGSGPKDTNLLDPAFPDRLADYALAVARRYPWLEDYTPINEPLTTARFSALYGHWFPHEQDDPSFARALINQSKATVLAMRAIRSVQPNARLIQTEDVGKTHSTEYMAYQAAFENERRWTSFDLLAGQLHEGDSMWNWLVYAGISPEELHWFRTNSCPPNLLAINYYLTSERFLDERLNLYPQESPGSNGRHTYMDVAALHVLPEGIGGFRSVLTQAWDRYRTPLCIGEAHLGGPVEEQLRWLNDAWMQSRDLRRMGVDVRAITVWALLGSFDWISLVTREENHYEPGPFDVRAPKPRPTALANMVRELATVGRHDHAVLSIPGWWRRPQRLRFLSENPGLSTSMATLDIRGSDGAPRQLLIVGADTPIRRELSDACERRFIPARSIEPKEMGDTLRAVRSPETWSVILTDTGLVEDSMTPEDIRSLHRLATTVAELCKIRSLPLSVFSSPIVFDGLGDEPCTEKRPLSPATSAGAALAEIERETSRVHPQTLILRRGQLFGPGLEESDAGYIGDSDVISPTYLPDLANATIDLLLAEEKGIWHLANTGCVGWFDFQLAIQNALGIRLLSTPEPTQSPKMRAIASERGWLMPDWQSALSRYAEHHQDQSLRSLQIAVGDD